MSSQPAKRVFAGQLPAGLQQQISSIIAVFELQGSILIMLMYSSAVVFKYRF